MQSEQPLQPVKNEERSISILPFDVQLQNIFAIEVVAKRFPIEIYSTQSSPNVELNLSEVQVNKDNLSAQVVLNVEIKFVDEPRPFEISFRLLGTFIYKPEYSVETLQMFLEQGSLSVMLPFARELLASLCIRLQAPPLLLPLIQLAPPPAAEKV